MAYTSDNFIQSVEGESVIVDTLRVGYVDDVLKDLKINSSISKIGEGGVIDEGYLYLKIANAVFEKSWDNKKSNFRLLLQKEDGSLIGFNFEEDEEIIAGEWNSFKIPSGILSLLDVTLNQILYFSSTLPNGNYLDVYDGSGDVNDKPFFHLTYHLKRGTTKRVWVRPDNCQKGDLFYYDGEKVVRLPIGSVGQKLKMSNEDVPIWSD
ncbi:hypothetical protein J7K25_00870 [bacterium]|nr:hypothetical protein [bacterium]